MKPTVRLSELLAAVREMMGWCTECQEFTTGCCEPDARRYKCEKCGQRKVYGAEEASLMELFEVEDGASIDSVLGKYMMGGD